MEFSIYFCHYVLGVPLLGMVYIFLFSFSFLDLGISDNGNRLSSFKRNNGTGCLELDFYRFREFRGVRFPKKYLKTRFSG